MVNRSVSARVAGAVGIVAVVCVVLGGGSSQIGKHGNTVNYVTKVTLLGQTLLPGVDPVSWTVLGYVASC